MKLIILFLISAPLFADAPKPNVFTFNTAKPACSLLDGKLILPRMWPFGSWEDCAYALLSAAQQLDAMRDKLDKELQAQKQLVDSAHSKK